MLSSLTLCIRCSRNKLLEGRIIRSAHNAVYSASERNENTKQGLVPKEKWQWSLPEGHDTGIMVKNSYQSTRQLVPLVVNNPQYVTWYACGPTVYNSSHIGHASTYLQFDMIRRILTNYFGLNICMVMGITNMDNKIINRAMLYDREVMEVANTYEAEFFEDMKTLNILPPTVFIRVTEIIPQIIDFIQKILDKNQGYITPKGNVYFEYNAAHQSVAKLSGEFYEPDTAVTEKKFEKDICLWKSANPGEPYWDAPWGKGRPGWHIECSVIASMCFGDNMDIHSGATDLKFPHHEYEVAQCDAYHGCHQWVNYFLHTGHVQVSGGDKMSKSLGNFITIREFLETAQDSDILRLLCCHTIWSKSFRASKFVKRAGTLKDSVTSLLKQCKDISGGRVTAKVNNSDIESAIQVFENAVITNFKNDFHIAGAFVAFKEFIKQVEASIQLQDELSDVRGAVKAVNTIEKFLDNLGFTFHKRMQP